MTIPKKVIETKEDFIVVENPAGTRQEVKSIVDLNAGDFCLTQQNVAVEKISKEEAEEVFKIIN